MQNTNFVILGISKNLFRKTISKFAPKIPISSNMSTLLYLFQYIFSILDFTQIRDFCAAQGRRSLVKSEGAQGGTFFFVQLFIAFLGDLKKWPI